MKINKWVAIVVIALIVIALAVRSGFDFSNSDNPFGDNQVVQNTDEDENQTSSNDGEEFAVNSDAQDQLYVGRGEFVEVDWEAYRSKEGYLIPRQLLLDMAAGSYLMFEGEQRQEGIHDVMSVVFPDERFAPQVGSIGLRLRDEGSFWRYEASYQQLKDYELADDLLMVFAQEKRRNWNIQGMEGNPIVVWLSTGEVTFQPDEDISLSETQNQIVADHDVERCPVGDSPLEENPLGDPQSHEVVIAQIGSSSCITLMVRGQIANWFDGPRDGIRYRPDETSIFLVPVDWNEDDMLFFLEAEGFDISAISELH